MRRVVGFLKWIGFMLLILPVVISKVEGQGHILPIVMPGGSPVSLSLPDLQEFEQPVIYSQWWFEIGACFHLIVPQELTRSVRFVYVNSVTDGSRSGWRGLRPNRDAREDHLPGAPSDIQQVGSDARDAAHARLLERHRRGDRLSQSPLKLGDVRHPSVLPMTLWQMVAIVCGVIVGVLLMRKIDQL